MSEAIRLFFSAAGRMLVVGSGVVCCQELYSMKGDQFARRYRLPGTLLTAASMKGSSLEHVFMKSQATVAHFEKPSAACPKTSCCRRHVKQNTCN